MAEWVKMPAIEGKHGGCLNCGPRPSFFTPTMRIAVGFGVAKLERDGETVWTESGEDFDECMSGEQAEAIASADPDHDWRIVLDAPLSNRTHQRHGPGEWVLIEQGMGFA